MMAWFHPGLIYIVGAPFVPLLKGRLKKAYLLLLPCLAFVNLLFMSKGVFLSNGKTWSLSFLGYNLVLGRIDPLSLVFAYIFVIASFCMILYAFHIQEDGQHVAAFLYVGSTLGVVFSGDLITLFFFWEIMAWSALLLIWSRKTTKAYAAGFRYILVHFFGGACLLAGILIHVHTTGSIAFEAFRWGAGWNWDNVACSLILIAFLINAAVPPFHAWLADAYPEATVTGAVFLTAFTTKSAVYVLIRGFPGLELLAWLGAIMAIYGVVFAVLENDIRRLLAYHIISQVGYMVSGVGMGVLGTAAGEMALNGATAHAFCHILYKALLFMGAGAVLAVTGKSKLTELGGLYKSMPITFHLYMVGAYSISGFPLFNGFVSKTMVVEASGMWHMPVIYLMLEGAAIGTFLHTGLKLPWGVWFSKDKPVCEAKEPPLTMLIAMGMTAFLCTLIGVYPKILYDILPYPVHYEPYSPALVIGMIQLLVFTFAAFWLLRNMLHGEPTISLDLDWFYRVAGRKVMWFCRGPLMAFAKSMDRWTMSIVGLLISFSNRPTETLSAKKRELKLMVNRFLRLTEGVERHVPLMIREQENPGSGRELPSVTLGASILMILLLFSIYLAFYLAISD
jgi:multicomponent Na+:H+ antiporter subunit D